MRFLGWLVVVTVVAIAVFHLLLHVPTPGLNRDAFGYHFHAGRAWMSPYGRTASFIIPLFLIVVPAVTLVVVLTIRSMAALFRGSQRKDSEAERCEAALVQDLHRGMTRLEKRVESLETILLDRSASASRSREDAALGGIR